MNDLLCIDNLKKSYGRKEVLKGINLKLEKGKVLGILGPNGSGKTTLLNILGGFLKPSSGKVLIDEEILSIESKRSISFMQDKNIFSPWMKVIDAMEFYKDFFEDFNYGKAEVIIERMNIDKKDRVKSLSKGTIEKLSLALTLSRDSRIYILDEPIAGVDPVAREIIIDNIIDNLNEGSSMIITTHLVNELERIFDEVAFIRDGIIVKTGSAEDLRISNNKSIEELYKDIFR